jgi:hypothetical protein
MQLVHPGQQALLPTVFTTSCAQLLSLAVPCWYSSCPLKLSTVSEGKTLLPSENPRFRGGLTILLELFIRVLSSHWVQCPELKTVPSQFPEARPCHQVMATLGIQVQNSETVSPAVRTVSCPWYVAKDKSTPLVMVLIKIQAELSVLQLGRGIWSHGPPKGSHGTLGFSRALPCGPHP